MGNLLTRPEGVVDEVYCARKAEDFACDSTAFTWNSRRGGLMMQPPSRSARRSLVVAKFTSQPVVAAFPFQEVLPSWNIELDEAQQGYRIFLRFAAGTSWSPWFYLGSGGTAHQRQARKLTSHPGWGDVHVDYVVLKKAASRFQFRIELDSPLELLHTPATRPVLRRFWACYSNTTGDVLHGMPTSDPGVKGAAGIAVPYRSQLDVSNDAICREICCPTCVSMVLEFHGKNFPTETIAAAAYDPEYKIFGAWPRAAQVASLHGMEAWVQRFRSHEQVKTLLAKGLPVMASIRVKLGELANADYGKGSNGHLILLRGYCQNGDYIVNDPYIRGPQGEEVHYSASDLEQVWLERGGVGILIQPRQ